MRHAGFVGTSGTTRPQAAAGRLSSIRGEILASLNLRTRSDDDHGPRRTAHCPRRFRQSGRDSARGCPSYQMMWPRFPGLPLHGDLRALVAPWQVAKPWARICSADTASNRQALGVGHWLWRLRSARLALPERAGGLNPKNIQENTRPAATRPLLFVP